MTRTIQTLRRAVLGSLLAVLATTGIASGATSNELLSCQKQFESQIRGFSNVIYQRLFGCAQLVVECKLAQEIDAVDPTACLARAAKNCTTAPTKVSEQLASRSAKVVGRCGLIAFGELEQFIAGLGFFNVAAACPAGNVNDLVGCVFAEAKCSAERQLLALDPRAQDSLTMIGVAGSFPCVGP